MKRFILLSFLLLFCAPDIYAARKAGAPPNIIFIFIDDMGYGDLSVTGNLDVQTTHIDRLAAEGIRFTQFYVNSPICSPSRVACTTGQYPARHLINSYLNSRAKNRARGMADYLDPKAPAIARAFQSAGYATAHFGKWHMGGGRDVDDAPLPQVYGFDESLVSFEGLGDRILPPGGLSKQSEKLGRGEIKWVEKHEQTGIYVDRSIDFIKRNQTKPFYLHLWLNDVHDGHKPRADYLQRFAKFSDRPALQQFYAVLKQMDDELGRLIKSVDDLGLAKKTMFVVTSDNGPTAWPRYREQGQQSPGSTAGMRGRKWSLYEGGIRMPLIVRWKGKVPAGVVDEKTVSSAVDFFPTFTRIAGVKAPIADFDGEDMSAAYLGQPKARTKPIFWEYGRDASYLKSAHPLDQSPNLAMREGDWKLLINDDGTRMELYDLSGTDREYFNVAGRHPVVAKRLADRLIAWRKALPKLPGATESVAIGDWQRFPLRTDTRLKGAAAPKISGNTVRVTAEVTSDGKDGVVVAQGGAAMGYSLHITDGRPVWDVRIRDGLFSATGGQPLPKGRVKLAAEITMDGRMTLKVDDKVVATAKASSSFPVEPLDGLEVGLDDKGNVGNYQGQFKFGGVIHSAMVEVQTATGDAQVGGRVTRWAGDMDPLNPLPEYPRPQMARERWLNLNGQWHYAIAATNKAQPKNITGLITVPFPIESTLSGVRKNVGAGSFLWYRRNFDATFLTTGERLLLHFSAVDWEAVVWVNGKKIGEHRGGYDPFSFDINTALNEGGNNELVVRVWDPTDDGFQPRGKQVKDPRGIWYTSVSGIWQTVWLEPVPAQSIAGLKFVPDIHNRELALTVAPNLPDGRLVVKAQAFENGEPVGEVTGFAGQLLHLPVSDMKLWEPDSPHLYDLVVGLWKDGKLIDGVQSYFGMRETRIAKDAKGVNRMFLNGRPLFQFGPLDQGWWPDGLYTPPTEEAMIFDIEMTRKMGFNMIRKHVKVEPARWYLWADKLGMLVWQDLPSGMQSGARGQYHVKKGAKEDAELPKEGEAIYRRELRAMMDSFHNHPSVVVWVPFNEGWGQFKTFEILNWTKQYDPTRIVDGASGWEDRGSGEMIDMHVYPGPGMFPVEAKRASVLGEFGGLGWPVTGHLWWNKRNWGYRTYTSQTELKANYANLLRQMPALIEKGLSAAVYTQTTDVEGEVNGLMTYDRSVMKMDAEWLADLARKLYE